MSATFRRRFVSALLAPSLLVSCAHGPEPIRDGSVPPPGPIEPYEKNPILQFCEDYEMVCILAGIAAFGAAIAIIRATSGDADDASDLARF